MWEHIDGDGLWKRLKNSETGEESIKVHSPRVVFTCTEHEFSNDIPPSRKISCIKCGQEITFVVGHHELKNGKLHIHPKN